MGEQTTAQRWAKAGRPMSEATRKALAAANARRAEEADRTFWSRCEKRPNGCWLWTGPKTPDGYGVIRFRRRMTRAHRKAFALAGGTLQPGMEVMHSCDTPACINPEHLSLGTHAENMRQMVERGRVASGDRSGARTHRHLRPKRFNEKNPAAKLTMARAEEIRAACAAGERQADVGARYGVSQACVSQLVRGLHWTVQS